MSVINLETANRTRLNAPRDIAAGSSLTGVLSAALADTTLGGTFINTGSQVIVTGVATTYVVKAQDGSADLSFTTAGSGVAVVGPFDPHRYNDANGLVTVKCASGTGTVLVVDIASRRAARSSVTR